MSILLIKLPKTQRNIFCVSAKTGIDLAQTDCNLAKFGTNAEKIAKKWLAVDISMFERSNPNARIPHKEPSRTTAFSVVIVSPGSISLICVKQVRGVFVVGGTKKWQPQNG
jgi:hypothetical protein